jgi:hypothetical protein
MSESAMKYPYLAICEGCDKKVWIFKSKRTGAEFPCSSNAINDWHSKECNSRKWRRLETNASSTSQTTEPIAETQTAQEHDAYQSFLIGLRELLKALTEAVDQQIKETGSDANATKRA